MSVLSSVNQFSFTRFQLVLKRYVALNQRTWLIGFLCIAAFLLLIAVLPTISNIFNVAEPGFIAIRELTISLYSLGGLILTSMIFNEIHTSTKAFQFLTLPSTTLEKLWAAWFTSSIVYTVVSMSSIVVLSILIELIKGVNTGIWDPFHIFNPFTSDVFSAILSFLFYQSIFLLGAVYFKKNNFIKTFLVIVVFVLGVIFVLNIALLIFGLSQNQEFFLNIQLDAQRWLTPVKYFLGIGFTLFFIWLSFLQLKNKQVA